MSVHDRFNEVKSHKLCLNCLKSNHPVFKCFAAKCKQCNKKHHTLLHRNEVPAAPAQTVREFPNAPVPKQTDSQSSTTTSNHAVSKHSEVLLFTALINVYDKDGKAHVGRALLDSGSQSNFMTYV